MTKQGYSIKALAYMNGWTISQFAEKAEMKTQRLYDISAGRRTMTGAELLKLAKVAKVKPEQVKA